MRKRLFGWRVIQQLLHQRHEQCFIGRLFDDLDAKQSCSKDFRVFIKVATIYTLVIDQQSGDGTFETPK